LQLKKELPLPPSCLSVNLGVPLITVVTKTDSLLHGPLRSYLDQHCLFIQRHLRLHCLPYASALVFVSAKTGTNVGRLYQYILNRLYDKEGREGERAEVVDKHALFIPTGWDSLNLIGKQEGEEEEVYERTVHRDEQGVVVDRDIVICESWQQQLLSRVTNGDIPVTAPQPEQPEKKVSAENNGEQKKKIN